MAEPIEDSDEDFRCITVGTGVILDRHEAVNSYDGWDGAINEYVEKKATVTELTCVDNQGCPVVPVDVDVGQFLRRIWDMTLK